MTSFVEDYFFTYLHEKKYHLNNIILHPDLFTGNIHTLLSTHSLLQLSMVCKAYYNVTHVDAMVWTPILLEKYGKVTPIHKIFNKLYPSPFNVINKTTEVLDKFNPTHVIEIDLLLKHGYDINEEDVNTGKTPIYRAAEMNLPNAMQILMNRGANVNYINKKRGNFNLAIAATYRGAINSLEFLMELDFNGTMKSKDKWGNTLLDVAIYRNKQDVVDFLILIGRKKEIDEKILLFDRINLSKKKGKKVKKDEEEEEDEEEENEEDEEKEKKEEDHAKNNNKENHEKEDVDGSNNNNNNSDENIPSTNVELNYNQKVRKHRKRSISDNNDKALTALYEKMKEKYSTSKPLVNAAKDKNWEDVYIMLGLDNINDSLADTYFYSQNKKKSSNDDDKAACEKNRGYGNHNINNPNIQNKFGLNNDNCEVDIRSQFFHINDKNSFGFTAVHYAAITNDINHLIFCHRNGANLGLLGNFGRTPTMLASMNGHYEPLEYLLIYSPETIHTRYDHSKTAATFATGFTSCLNLINSYKGCDLETYHSWEGFAYTGLVINRESM